MHAVVRRYEGVDQARKDELSKQVNETLIPRLSALPGFTGFFMLEGAEKGVLTSISLFKDAAQADESTQIAGSWIREAKLESVFPNAPKVTTGAVTASKVVSV